MKKYLLTLSVSPRSLTRSHFRIPTVDAQSRNSPLPQICLGLNMEKTEKRREKPAASIQKTLSGGGGLEVFQNIGGSYSNKVIIDDEEEEESNQGEKALRYFRK